MMQLSLFDAESEGLSETTEPLMQAALGTPLESAPVEGPAASVPPFIHPLADSRIQLDGIEVAYRLRRASRRSIGLTVGLDGLSVSVPRWASRRDIDAALRDKADWIMRKIRSQGERAEQLKSVERDWLQGATLPYLGRSVRVQAASSSVGAFHDELSILRLKLPQNTSPLDVQRAAVLWLKKQALPIFSERCDHYAPLLDVQYTRLALSSARTRWGSAHASGAIRLNWRLIHFPLPVVDYVVAHELAHLREMNHSPRFWALVESVIPDVAAAQRTLRETVLPVWQ